MYITYEMIFKIASLIVLLIVIVVVIQYVKKRNLFKRPSDEYKILITKDDLMNSNYLADLLGSIAKMVLAIVLFIISAKGIRYEPTMMFSFITLVFACIFAFIGLRSYLTEESAHIALKQDKYYFITDKLERKYHNENGSKYYLYFNETNIKVATDYFQFTSSEIGEEFYICYLGLKKIAFNKKFYDISDPSKIR